MVGLKQTLQINEILSFATPDFSKKRLHLQTCATQEKVRPLKIPSNWATSNLSRLRKQQFCTITDDSFTNSLQSRYYQNNCFKA